MTFDKKVAELKAQLADLQSHEDDLYNPELKLTYAGIDHEIDFESLETILETSIKI